MADPVVLVERANRGAHRPLLDDDPAGTMSAMAADRADLYREVADVTIDVGNMRVQDVVDAVLAVAR